MLEYMGKRHSVMASSRVNKNFPLNSLIKEALLEAGN